MGNEHSIKLFLILAFAFSVLLNCYGTEENEDGDESSDVYENNKYLDYAGEYLSYNFPAPASYTNLFNALVRLQIPECEAHEPPPNASDRPYACLAGVDALNDDCISVRIRIVDPNDPTPTTEEDTCTEPPAGLDFCAHPCETVNYYVNTVTGMVEEAKAADPPEENNKDDWLQKQFGCQADGDCDFHQPCASYNGDINDQVIEDVCDASSYFPGEFCLVNNGYDPGTICLMMVYYCSGWGTPVCREGYCRAFPSVQAIRLAEYRLRQICAADSGKQTGGYPEYLKYFPGMLGPWNHR